MHVSVWPKEIQKLTSETVQKATIIHYQGSTNTQNDYSFTPKYKNGTQIVTGQSIRFTQCQAGELQSLNANSFKISSLTLHATATIFLIVFLCCSGPQSFQVMLLRTLSTTSK